MSDNNKGYKNQSEVKKWIRQKFEESDQTELLKAFTEKGKERFSNFIDSNGTHFSLMSRMNLFLPGIEYPPK
jgi:hypothetical protein